MSSENQKQEKVSKAVKPKFIFGKQNYILMIAAVLIIAIGFIMMSGNKDIYSTMKITIAPIIVLMGFGLGIFAIMKKPTENLDA
ncbi:DUF3098 domain-containing protein [Bacteroidia bacterium]|jgi:cell division protein FtsL|nr:DUF3098 domain-containing protein [Bacteroidia bacterium]